ncbi:ATP-grasp domain-containing protein [Clostridium fungisolvens]|uniref:Phosphoribosylamine--glycine ligase n=1 Tax=Clostridium fungisolvens TaxID=1604897 RepID=A0A6V8SCM8_9CLOT|nr:ATP-grasp domain-containing protein [Clostridium fungisolvens]GFP74215.1 Phosphoribosylamine--glycine ligase [Clostridium fungisolvens]
MKKIMILGASILQLPAIRKAKDMGLKTIVVDMDKNAIGFKEADVCLYISTIDIDSVVEAAKKYQIDGIITLASDMPMRTIARVAKELNIVGITEDTAFKATNKVSMRTCLKENDVPVPTFYRVKNEEEYKNAIRGFQSKLIVKPADNSGSRGVFLIEDIHDEAVIKYAYEYSRKYSRSGEIIVEDYMEGPEVSVETLSINGEVSVIAITDKLTTGAPRFVEMGHSEPSKLERGIQEQIRDVAKRAVKAIGIENGPSHTEIKVTKDGPKIVEIGARLGGDNITTSLVPLSTGVNMVECCIRIALGEKPDIEQKFHKSSAIRYFDTPVGILKDIEGIEEAKKLDGIKQISFTKNIGDKVGIILSSVDRIGFVIAQDETTEKAIKDCEEAIKRILITVEDK